MELLSRNVSLPCCPSKVNAAMLVILADKSPLPAPHVSPPPPALITSGKPEVY